MEGKIRENRVRRKADRRGYQLVKCRRRDPLAIGYGLYALLDIDTGGSPLPHNTYGDPYVLDLDEAEKWLDELNR